MRAVSMSISIIGMLIATGISGCVARREVQLPIKPSYSYLRNATIAESSTEQQSPAPVSRTPMASVSDPSPTLNIMDESTPR